jgi:hypothetical protein
MLINDRRIHEISGNLTLASGSYLASIAVISITGLALSVRLRD